MDAKNFAFRVACTTAEYQGGFCKDPRPRQIQTTHWAPPPREIIKFNVDGAHVPRQQHGAWGVIARDSEGQIVAARARRALNVSDAFATELRAVEKAINLAAELGVVRMMVETDTHLVEQALNRHAPDFSKEAQAIKYIKVHAKLWFASCEFLHCKRDANVPAHCLAQLGLNLHDGDGLVLDDDVPAIVADAVSGDLAQTVS